MSAKFEKRFAADQVAAEERARKLGVDLRRDMVTGQLGGKWFEFTVHSFPTVITTVGGYRITVERGDEETKEHDHVEE